MFGSETLDAVLVLVTLYGVLSLAGVFVVGLTSALMKRRARMLEEGVAILLHDEMGHNLTRDLYQHPAIDCLAGRRRRPTHIPPRNFGMALLDLVMQSGYRYQPTVAFGSSGVGPAIRAAIEAMPDPWMVRLLSGLADIAGDDPARFRQAVEEWFEATMVEVSRHYRMWAQGVALAFALVVSLGLNIDTFAVISAGPRDDNFRQTLATVGETTQVTSGAVPAPSSAPYIDSLRGLITTKRLPIGWSRQYFVQVITGTSLLSFLAGTLITAAIVALLAPVVFDVLKRFTLRLAAPSAAGFDAERYRQPVNVPAPPVSSASSRSRLPPA